MVRFLILVSFCAVLCISGCASRSDDLATVRARGTIHIGVKGDTPPFGVRRGDVFWGFDIDMATAVARKLGLDPEFVQVTSADRIERLRSGEVDLLFASLTITRSREKLIDFSIPYFQDGYALLVKNGSPITGYDSLVGRKVGVGAKTTGISNLKQVAPEAVVREYAGYGDMLAALDRNEVEAIAGEQLVLVALVKEKKIASAYHIAGNRFSAEPFGIGLRHDQSALRAAVNHALQEMWENGEWRQIADMWVGPNAPYATDLHFVITPYPR